jgi:hypothetical protein
MIGKLPKSGAVPVDRRGERPLRGVLDEAEVYRAAEHDLNGPCGGWVDPGAGPG